MKHIAIILALSAAAAFGQKAQQPKQCAKGEYLSQDGRCLHDQTGKTFKVDCNTGTCMDPACRHSSVTLLGCIHGDDPAITPPGTMSTIKIGIPTTLTLDQLQDAPVTPQPQVKPDSVLCPQGCTCKGTPGKDVTVEGCTPQTPASGPWYESTPGAPIPPQAPVKTETPIKEDGTLLFPLQGGEYSPVDLGFTIQGMIPPTYMRCSTYDSQTGRVSGCILDSGEWDEVVSVLNQELVENRKHFDNAEAELRKVIAYQQGEICMGEKVRAELLKQVKAQKADQSESRTKGQAGVPETFYVPGWIYYDLGSLGSESAPLGQMPCGASSRPAKGSEDK